MPFFKILCASPHFSLIMNKKENNIYFKGLLVNIPALILDCSFARWYHWGTLGKGYTGFLSITSYTCTGIYIPSQNKMSTFFKRLMRPNELTVSDKEYTTQPRHHLAGKTHQPSPLGHWCASECGHAALGAGGGCTLQGRSLGFRPHLQGPLP